MATFITSRLTGQTISIGVETTTGYWKYNHNSTDSSVFSNGPRIITVANANGEFTIISCLSDGTVSGNITGLGSKFNQLTSFDGTGLSGLSNLTLEGNQLTSFDGTGLSGLTNLNLTNNPLTTFIGGDMGLITELDFSSNLGGWNITTLETFDGTGLSSLTYLGLQNNQLITLDISNQPLLQYLYVNDNQLTPSVNNSLLAQLAANELTNDWDSGEFYTSGGRTSAGTGDYDYLIGEGWTIEGADLVSNPVRKLRVKGISQQN